MKKGLLREAVKGLLPDEVLWRKKAVSQDLASALPTDGQRHDAGSARRSGAPLFDVVRRKRVEELLDEERSIPWYGQLMTTPQTIAYLLQLDHWLRHYHVQIV